MCIRIKLLADYNGYKAGRVVNMNANTALSLIERGVARIAEWGEM